MKIVQATDKDMPAVRALFREYQASLGVDLCFLGFEQELATLPGDYAPPHGAIFLAVQGTVVAGCVGIRPREEVEAELKRLYVRPSHRGRGFGARLFRTAMSRARAIGYACVVLDTLPSMRVARSLYVDYGFHEVSAYDNNPAAGVRYYRFVFADA